jgi:P27 family predicted phage terminase small subunit
MSAANQFAGVPSVNSAAADSGKGIAASIISEIPDMPTKMSAKEKKIWEHVTLALLEYGLIHRTDGLTLSIICRTYVDWVESTDELSRYKAANNGSYITESANGYRQPHPLYYVVRDHKKSLLDWLPEAALTIPSFHKIKGDQVESPQGDLFADPVEAHKQRKVAAGMRLVKD